MDISAEIGTLFAKVAAAFADHDGAPKVTPVHIMAAHDHVSRAVRQEFDRLMSHRDPSVLSTATVDDVSESAPEADVEAPPTVPVKKAAPQPPEPVADPPPAPIAEGAATAEPANEAPAAETAPDGEQI